MEARPKSTNLHFGEIGNMPGTQPRKTQRNTSPRRTSESKREKAAPDYAAPSMVRALRETTRTSQKRAAVGEKLFW